MRLKKQIIIALLVCCVGIGAVSVGYGFWTDSMQVKGTASIAIHLTVSNDMKLVKQKGPLEAVDDNLGDAILNSENVVEDEILETDNADETNLIEDNLHEIEQVQEDIVTPELEEEENEVSAQNVEDVIEEKEVIVEPKDEVIVEPEEAVQAEEQNKEVNEEVSEQSQVDTEDQDASEDQVTDGETTLYIAK